MKIQQVCTYLKEISKIIPLNLRKKFKIQYKD